VPCLLVTVLPTLVSLKEFRKFVQGPAIRV